MANEPVQGGGLTPAGSGSNGPGGMRMAGVRPCPSCNTPVNVHATVCPNCGENVAIKEKTVRCRRCHHSASANLVVCPHCGRDLQPATSRWLTWGAPLLVLLLLAGLLSVRIARGDPGQWMQRQGERVGNLLTALTSRVQPEFSVAMIPPGQDPDDPLVSQAIQAGVGEAASADGANGADNGGAGVTTSGQPDALAVAAKPPDTAADSAGAGTADTANPDANAAAGPPADAPAEVPADQTANQAVPPTAEVEPTATTPPTATSEPTATTGATATAPPTATSAATATAQPTATAQATATSLAAAAATASPAAGAATATAARTTAAITATAITATATLTSTAKLAAASATTATTGITVTATPSVSLLALMTPTPIAAAATATPAVRAVYTVKAGDTAFDIALEYDITVEELLAANNLSEDDVYTIQPGDALNIPAPTPTSATPSLSTATPGPTPATYTVRAGDTISEIARRLDVTTEDLLAANDMTINDARGLQPGDVLTLPGAAGTATPAATAAAATATPATANTATPAAAAAAPSAAGNADGAAALRVDAPRLRSPENGSAVSCGSPSTLNWLPVSSVRPTDIYVVHIGYVNSIAADGSEEIIWVLTQPQPAGQTSWQLDNDFCGLAPVTQGKQWRWYVEVVERTAGGLQPVSPASAVWGFAWQ